MEPQVRARSSRNAVDRALRRMFSDSLIDRVYSARGYVVHHGTAGVTMLCTQCRTASVIAASQFHRFLRSEANAAGFHVSATIIEVTGLCGTCAAQKEAQGSRLKDGEKAGPPKRPAY